MKWVYLKNYVGIFHGSYLPSGCSMQQNFFLGTNICFSNHLDIKLSSHTLAVQLIVQSKFTLKEHAVCSLHCIVIECYTWLHYITIFHVLSNLYTFMLSMWFMFLKTDKGVTLASNIIVLWRFLNYIIDNKESKIWFLLFEILFYSQKSDSTT